MLVFNEGVPRAGKSYDAVKNHILPTLKKGRRVYARLNGLRHEKIAKHLGMAESDVHALLELVDTKDVTSTFACTQDETGKWCIPDKFKDALVVIDEVHEFYVNERKPLEPAIENFWALLGQNGGDAVIMTQWINRLHSAVKARIERKNTFQKLTAVGAKSRYRVTYFHTTSPGKFEKVGGQTLKYDAAIFPLYDGYAPGAQNTEVYEEGGKNVWGAMGLKAAIYGVVGIVAIYVFVGFFSPDEPESEPAAKPSTQVAAASSRPQPTAPQAAPVAAPVAPPDPYAELTVEQRYVAEMSERARLRLAMLVEINGERRAWVQWIDKESGEVIEQLEGADLESLGYAVTFERYGIRIAAGKKVMLATPWPYTAPVRERDARLYNLSADGTGAAPASVASGGGAGASNAPPSAGMLIGVGPRAMTTFPESVQNRYGGQ